MGSCAGVLLGGYDCQQHMPARLCETGLDQTPQKGGDSCQHSCHLNVTANETLAAATIVLVKLMVRSWQDQDFEHSLDKLQAISSASLVHHMELAWWLLPAK